MVRVASSDWLQCPSGVRGESRLSTFQGWFFERNNEKVGKVGSEKARNEKVGTRA